jgi:hypothetical protein
MKIYANLGWKVVDEITLGKGKANADGLRCRGGAGIKLWTMVWWPKPAGKQ